MLEKKGAQNSQSLIFSDRFDGASSSELLNIEPRGSKRPQCLFFCLLISMAPPGDDAELWSLLASYLEHSNEWIIVVRFKSL